MDYNETPCALVETDQGVDVVIPLALSEYGRATSLVINTLRPSSISPSGYRATDAFQHIVFAPPCGHDECVMTIDLPLN